MLYDLRVRYTMLLYCDMLFCAGGCIVRVYVPRSTASGEREWQQQQVRVRPLRCNVVLCVAMLGVVLRCNLC